MSKSIKKQLNTNQKNFDKELSECCSIDKIPHQVPTSARPKLSTLKNIKRVI